MTRTSAVICVWNKREDLRENLLAIRAQSVPFHEVVVVDNHSEDGTAEMVRNQFPEVRLIRMPHARYGACETFNLGFESAGGDLLAILDDDVVLPPEWHERMLAKLAEEPETTALLSSKVVEPGMPASFRDAPGANEERYMATFRGCASLARKDVLRRAGYYDEVFFIYGNERDLAARILNLGHRIKQVPSVEVFHKTPFGIKRGRRSLYFHVRNFWLYTYKYCTVGQLAGGLAGILRRNRGGSSSKSSGNVDAVGTLGAWASLRETPGGVWIAVQGTLASLRHLPHCLRQRNPCRAPDFRGPFR